MELQTPNTTIHIFFTIFLTIYLSGHLLLFRRWPPHLRREASSSLISLFHGTPVALMSLHAILRSPDPHTSFASPNSDLHSRALDFSIAYFSLDLLHYLIFFSPSGVVFVVHHIGTLYVFLTCRFVVGHGAVAVLEILVVAEATSACQNAWGLAGTMRRRGEGEGSGAARVYDRLRVPFLGFYSLVRGFLGPVVVWRVVVGFYGSGASEGLVPRWAWGSWVAVTVVGVVGSVLWVLGHWREWCRERSGRVRDKASLD